VGLAHLTSRTDKVELLNGESFSVRGLGFLDIQPIVQANFEPLALLFDRFSKGGVPGLLTDTAVMITAIAQVAPAAFRQIVAAGADEPDVNLVDLLPMPAQLEALEKIAMLTFEGHGGVKKVGEMVIRVLDSLRVTMGSF